MAIRLVDTEGRPVAGAVVGANFGIDADVSPRPATAGAYQVMSDARGELALRLWMPPWENGKTIYALRYDGDHPLAGLSELTRDELRRGEPIAIVMHPACRVRLRAESPGFREVEETYHAEPRGGRWRRLALVATEGDGRRPYLLSVHSTKPELEFLLPPARFKIWIGGDRVDGREVPVTVEPGHRVKSVGIIDLPPSEVVRLGIFEDYHHLSPSNRGDAAAEELRLRPVRSGLDFRVDLMMAHGLAYSPDGRTLATAHWNNLKAGGVKLWELSAGRVAVTLPAPVETGGVEALAFSPDGRWLAGAVGESATPAPPWSVVLWDVAARRRVRAMRGHASRITALAFAPDGQALATGGDDATVRLWEVASGREVGRIEANSAPIQSIAYAPDGKTLAIVSRFALRLWDVPGRRFRATLEDGDFWVNAVAFAPDGRTLAAAGGTFVRPPGDHLNPNRREREGRVRLYDMTTDPPVRRAELVPLRGGPAKVSPINPNSFFSDVAFTPGGRRVAAVLMGAIVIWDARSGARQDVIRLRGGASSDRLAISPDGRWIAATQDGTARVLDLVPPGP
jgi:WD40 repeat protein